MMQLPEIELYQPKRRRPTYEEFARHKGFGMKDVSKLILPPNDDHSWIVTTKSSRYGHESLAGYIDKDGRLHNVDMVDDPPELPESMAETCVGHIYQAVYMSGRKEIVYRAMDSNLYYMPDDGPWEILCGALCQYKPIRYIGRWKRGNVEGGAA